MWVGVVWACIVILVWLWRKICVGEWCCEVFNELWVAVFYFLSADINLYVCVCVCVCVCVDTRFRSHWWSDCGTWGSHKWHRLWYCCRWREEVSSWCDGSCESVCSCMSSRGRYYSPRSYVSIRWRQHGLLLLLTGALSVQYLLRLKNPFPNLFFSFPGIGNLQMSLPGFLDAREWRKVWRHRHWLRQSSQLAVPTGVRAGGNGLFNNRSASKHTTWTLIWSWLDQIAARCTGTGQWAHLIMPFCLASSNVRHGETTCVVCMRCHIETTCICFTRVTRRMRPTPTGNRQCIIWPRRNPWLSPQHHLFGIWEITAQCDAWFSALYKYSYLLTYLLTP